METEIKHICFTCDHAIIEYSDIGGKDRAYCQVSYKEMSRYKDKVFANGKLIHCPALKERAKKED